MSRPLPVAGAPLVDHPVVVGLHAQRASSGSLSSRFRPLVERLAAEAGQRVGEADRRLDVVGVHVGQAVLLDPAAGADLVEGHGRDVEVVEADRRRQLGERVDEVVVEPPVAPLAVGDALLVAEDAAREVELGPVAHHPGADDPRYLAGSRLGPQVGRLHDVVVDRDDPGQVDRHGPDFRTCSSSAPRPRAPRPDRRLTTGLEVNFNSWLNLGQVRGTLSWRGVHVQPTSPRAPATVPPAGPAARCGARGRRPRTGARGADAQAPGLPPVGTNFAAAGPYQVAVQTDSAHTYYSPATLGQNGVKHRSSCGATAPARPRRSTTGCCATSPPTGSWWPRPTRPTPAAATRCSPASTT